MKTSLSLLVAVSVLFGIVSSPETFARSKKATPPPRYDTLIASVGPTSITVSEMKTTKTYTIGQFTEILVNGQKATVGDLKPGMIVSITLGGATQASRIVAQDAPHR